MKKTIIWTIIVLAVIAGIIVLVQKTKKPGIYDEFAVCIEKSGATFFGTFWCPYCQGQKKMFGRSAKLLPYTECSTPDGKGQKQVCADAEVTGYPTWEFADGSRMSGRLEMETLAEKTMCALPKSPSTI